MARLVFEAHENCQHSRRGIGFIFFEISRQMKWFSLDFLVQKDHNSLLAGLRATNDQLLEAQEEKCREFGAGGTERDAAEVKVR